MIRIANPSLRWIPPLSCFSIKASMAPSTFKIHTFTRTFFTLTKEQTPFIQNSAPPRDVLAIALKSAVESGKLKQVKHLLQTGAKPNQGFDNGSYILHHAAVTLHSNIVKELIQAGAHINTKTLKEGNTPLHLGCALDHKLVVEELLVNKAKFNERNHDGNTPLEEAILAQSTDCCKLLYDAGANIEEPNPTSGYTPLMTACKLGAYNVVELLLILGADKSFKRSAVPFSAEVIRPDILKLLGT